MLAHVPTRADAELQSPLGDVVERRRHLREQRRVAVSVADDEHAEAHAFGDCGHRGEQRPTLEVVVGLIEEVERRDEVVGYPGAVPWAVIHAAGGLGDPPPCGGVGVKLGADEHDALRPVKREVSGSVHPSA